MKIVFKNVTYSFDFEIARLSFTLIVLNNILHILMIKKKKLKKEIILKNYSFLEFFKHKTKQSSTIFNLKFQ